MLAKKRQLLILISSLSSGGAERVTVDLSNSLQRNGYEVSILTLEGLEGDFYQTNQGVTRIALNLGGNANKGFNKYILPLKRFWEIRLILKQRQPDVLLGMMTKINIYALLASQGLGIPVIISERNYPPKQSLSRFVNFLRKIIYQRAYAVVVLTQEVVQWFKKNIQGLNVVVISSFVIWPLPNLEPTLSLNDFFRDDDIVLLSVGRLHYQKGHDLLLKAFSQIADSNKRMKLVILGEGAKRQELKRFINQEGLNKCVFLPGRAGNIGEWYKRADIFVLSSRYEGFSNALKEAMASGCACISFDCNDGPRDMISHNINGLLVPPENIDALALAMNSLIKDKRQRVKLANRAKKIRETLSKEVVMAKWIKLFDEIS